MVNYFPFLLLAAMIIVFLSGKEKKKGVSRQEKGMGKSGRKKEKERVINEGVNACLVSP